MLPSCTVRGELLRDAALYLVAVVVLGTAANLIPGRHLAWWGKGYEPPRAGVDFQWLDVLSADTMRRALPRVVFLDTREATAFAGAHVAGARAISYTELKTELTPEFLAQLRSADAVVLYGETEEADVEQLLAQELYLRGLAAPYVLQGGFPAWHDKGFAEESAR